MMLDPPTSFRNSGQTSSNLSWPDSTHLSWRIVRTRICLSPLVFAPSGAAAFLMSFSPGLSLTGTLRCISPFAAADDAMTLGARLNLCGSSGGAGVVAVLVDFAGMVIFSPQDGQSISEPAPALSTASSWLQWGQSKTMSISRIGLNGSLCADTKPSLRFRPVKNVVLLTRHCLRSYDLEFKEDTFP